MTRAIERGLDLSRLLHAAHPDQRATPAWTQLQNQGENAGVKLEKSANDVTAFFKTPYLLWA